MARFAPPGPLGFGGAPLGDMFAKVDDATAEAALEAAWDSGIRYYDTAPHYGAGLSEHRFGAMLRRKPRDEYVISTKVGRLLEPTTEPELAHPFLSTMMFRRKQDYTAAGARRSVEDSLQRMGIGRIDVVYVHDLATDHLGDGYDAAFRIARDGAFRELIRMREEGMIRAWGLGVNLPEPCVRALQESDPDVFLLAGRYSLIDLAGTKELFPLCAERGAHVVVGGPYNSGLLAGGTTFDYQEAPPEQVAARDRMAAVAAKHGVDLKAAALQFCAANPVVASVIPGAKHADRVRQNAALMQAEVPAAFWAALKQQGLLPPEVPTP
ncbi:D-threo-aldose 1-dehydrogenase [Pseudoroseomonas deserti]|uniref:D-threo-aldose 1-dehydrogenase n=1 Tax=Teichococcus deserti TaxID=1817963 RepID=A0A1V2H5J8_9PROT|nr:aldo/keto reductase [Pseudoroseomonas deserti]ONG54984.1 D-threo-aldose 1-dehydrogenase [Pseudoroseomonas deserti]